MIKIKIPGLQITRRSLLKREEGTYHHNEKLTKEMPGFLSPGKGMLLELIRARGFLTPKGKTLEEIVKIHFPLLKKEDTSQSEKNLLRNKQKSH